MPEHNDRRSRAASVFDRLRADRSKRANKGDGAGGDITSEQSESAEAQDAIGEPGRLELQAAVRGATGAHDPPAAEDPTPGDSGEPMPDAAAEATVAPAPPLSPVSEPGAANDGPAHDRPTSQPPVETLRPAPPAVETRHGATSGELPGFDQGARLPEAPEQEPPAEQERLAEQEPPVEQERPAEQERLEQERLEQERLEAANPGVRDLGREAELDGAGDEPGGAPPASPKVLTAHPASATHPLPRCFAIANQKGGVGKTTTAINLGAAVAELGYRVLIVDLDPQGNATTGLGVNPRNLDASTYDALLHDVALEDIIEPTALRNLFIVPSTINLAGAEIELVPHLSRELKLRRALEPVKGDFDFILIDCPPSLGLLTVNGLAAATELIVPIQCEYYALEGLGQLLRNVGLVQSNLNPDLEVTTIILTMYDARTRLAEQVVDEVKSHFGDKVCNTVVPRTVRLSEAPSFGQPIIVFDPPSRGAIAYRGLAMEVSGGAPKRAG